jgi:hypothetical protein
VGEVEVTVLKELRQVTAGTVFKERDVAANDVSQLPEVAVSPLHARESRTES